MSKTVVVLGEGGATELLMVDDDETSVTWPPAESDAGLLSRIMPVEVYFCEGEMFYFARSDQCSH